MKMSYYSMIALLLCLWGAGAQCQNNYLLNFTHKDSRSSESVYFYLEELQAPYMKGRMDVIVLDDAFYRIHFLRLSEPSASSYLGCSKYADQAMGELLSIRQLLTEPVLYTIDQKQQAIETQCTALLENKGRPNSVFAMDLNSSDRIKMVGVHFDLCNCRVSGPSFSPLTDTLAMVRTIRQTTLFSAAEKRYWKEHIHLVLENAFVKSCLPLPDRLDKVYQASRE